MGKAWDYIGDPIDIHMGGTWTWRAVIIRDEHGNYKIRLSKGKMKDSKKTVGKSYFSEMDSVNIGQERHWKDILLAMNVLIPKLTELQKKDNPWLFMENK